MTKNQHLGLKIALLSALLVVYSLLYFSSGKVSWSKTVNILDTRARPPVPARNALEPTGLGKELYQ